MVSGDYAFARIQTLEQNLRDLKQLLARAFETLKHSPDEEQSESVATDIESFFKRKGEDIHVYEEGFQLRNNNMIELPEMKHIFLEEKILQESLESKISFILGSIIGIPLAIKIISWLVELASHASTTSDVAILSASVGIPSLLACAHLLKKIMKRCSEAEVKEIKSGNFKRVISDKITPEEKTELISNLS